MTDLLLARKPRADLLERVSALVGQAKVDGTELNDLAMSIGEAIGSHISIEWRGAMCLDLRVDSAGWSALRGQVQRPYHAKPSNEFSVYYPWGRLRVYRNPTVAAAPTEPVTSRTHGVEVGEDGNGWRKNVARLGGWQHPDGTWAIPPEKK